CTYSLNFLTSTGCTAISGERRSRLYRLTRKSRAKRSLIISSVGMRPRTMRIALMRSYGFASPGVAALSVLTAPESTPCISASISAWSSILSSLMLLHDEAGEVDGFHQFGLPARAADDLTNRLECVGAEFLF